MSDELFDIVDDNNIVIGQARRSIAHQRGLWHRATDILLFTSAGKLLVPRRSKTKESFPSTLDCSVGEHVQSGENYFDAAQRGLREELGVTGIDLRPLMEFQMAQSSNDNEINQLYEGIVDPNAVRFNPDEVESVSYYSLDELAMLLNTGTDSFSRWFEQVLRWYLDKPHQLRICRIDNPKLH